ncbi:hypothetical protein [Intestinirhabdus alba]|jgi:cyanate lyase|uniref:Uncharacterized protein n=1 Tax=Intestinirhabdus alba TaxID=2899544 RepID=A0A6L6IQE0_9ENTR|nr:hypothetical protein [Intestinirhabdus alba]MTH48729.1 hypothetical protein [Intestinirhabdus alba]
MDNNDIYFNYIKWSKINKGLTWDQLGAAVGYSALDTVMMCMSRKEMSQDIYNKLTAVLNISNDLTEIHFLKTVKKRNLENLRLRSDFTMHLIQYFMLYDIAISDLLVEIFGAVNGNFLSGYVQNTLTFENNTPRVTLNCRVMAENNFTPTYEEKSFSDFTKAVLEAKVNKNISYDEIATYLGIGNPIEAAMIVFQRKFITQDTFRNLNTLLGSALDDIKYPGTNVLSNPAYSAQVLSGKMNPHPLLFSMYKALCMYSEAFMELMYDNGIDINFSELFNLTIDKKIDEHGNSLIVLSFDIITNQIMMS